MNINWYLPYIGLPYAEADCAELVNRVQEEVFERQANLPTERAHGPRNLSAQLATALPDYATPTEQPWEGDLVVMQDSANLYHIGVYATPGGQPSVLHAMRRARTCLHPLRNLHTLNLTVEGFYRWRPQPN